MRTFNRVFGFATAAKETIVLKNVEITYDWLYKAKK